jgi:hypothetical protein
MCSLEPTRLCSLVLGAVVVVVTTIGATCLGAARIGAMGQSAGAQLVALLGTAPPFSAFDVGQYSTESSRVQAVADEGGPITFDATLLRSLHTEIAAAFGTRRLA